ncbi:MAG: hypothetical protein AAGF94_07075 [Pseudomonadota bacterium]
MSSERQDDQATSGMGGQGYYNRHSGLQNAGIHGQDARIRHAVELVRPRAEGLRIADFGCGPGRNSVGAMGNVVAALKERWPESDIVTCFNDQIGNDWADLFARLQDTESYLAQNARVRVEIAVGSFFEKVLSKRSLDLGLCFGSVHWLSRHVSVEAPGSLFFCDIPASAWKEIESQAAQDWQAFLVQRARELVPGGLLVLDMLASVPDPHDPSGVRAAGRGLYRAMGRCVEEMLEAGELDRELANRFVFPVVFPTEEQVRAPLDDGAPLHAVFEVLEIETDLLPNPLFESFQADGDREGYAKAYANFARAFSEATLRRYLFEPSSHTKEDTDRLAESFFERLTTRLAQDSEASAFEHLVMGMVLRRTERSV